MQYSGDDIEQLRPRLRFKVCYEVGFLCPDVDDIVQETVTRFLAAAKDDRVRNAAALGAFLNGICRNVISEYRRRSLRDKPMPEIIPEPPGRAIQEADLFEIRDAIARGMELAEPIIERKRVNDVTVIRFMENSQLLAASLELTELTKAIRVENDTKVLIDLCKVSRIDSTGLGVLMNCYCHAIKNSGALKLLHPDATVKRVLSVTRIDSVLQTFEDEAAALQSFEPRPCSAG